MSADQRHTRTAIAQCQTLPARAHRYRLDEQREPTVAVLLLDVEH